MATTTTVRFTLPQTLAQLDKLSYRVQDPGGSRRLALTMLENLIDSIKSGAIQGGTTIDWQIGGTAAVRASQTVTYTAKATADKKVTINAVDFVAKASNPGTNQFVLGSTKEDTCNSLATKINASTTAGVAGIVCAVTPANAATGTAKCASVVNGNKLQFGPVLFTVKTSLSDTSQSSLWFQNSSSACEVKVGGTDTAMATNFKEAINNHPSLKGLIVATSSTDTVTITAVEAGAAGNAIAHSQPSGATVTLSGSGTLTNGHDRVGPTGLTAGAAGVVTVYALSPGKCANAIAITTDDATPCTVGGATLANGAGDDVLPVTFTLA